MHLHFRFFSLVVDEPLIEVLILMIPIMKIQFFLVFILLAAVPKTLASFATGIDDDLHKYEDDCAQETGLDSGEIETIRKNQVVPDNEKANQWAKCMMQKHNVIKSDGTVNTDVRTITIPADTNTVILAFPICKSLTGRDIADTARLMMNCYLSNSGGLVMAIISRA